MQLNFNIVYLSLACKIAICSVILILLLHFKQFSTPAEKITQVINTIVDSTRELCEDCGLTVNHITGGAFQCFVQNAHEVTFRAHLHASPNSSTIELINYIIQWVENGASIAIRGILLSVDRRCDVVIESFSEPECHQVQPVTTHKPTTEDVSATMDTSTTIPLAERTVPSIETTAIPAGIGYVHIANSRNQ